MMKKFLAILTACMLLCGAAMAETTSAADTRVSVILIEGTEEEITETLYESEQGYSLWYDAERLVPTELYGHTCFAPDATIEEPAISLLIVDTDINPEDGEAFLGEAVGGYGPEAEISEPAWETLENGITIGTISAVEEGVVYRFYLVMDDVNVLCLTATYPLEAAEGFGVRFDHMVRTIEFSK